MKMCRQCGERPATSPGGFCGVSCANRARQYPDTSMKRFLASVRQIPAGCWEWTGKIEAGGYGRFRPTGSKRQVSTHRWIYEESHGPIGDLTIDHLCRNRRCVLVTHLEAVSIRENTMRGNTLPALNAAKTHCKRGHEFTPANTRVYKGGRNCRPCERAWATSSKRREQKRAHYLRSSQPRGARRK